MSTIKRPLRADTLAYAARRMGGFHIRLGRTSGLAAVEGRETLVTLSMPEVADILGTLPIAGMSIEELNALRMTMRMLRGRS